MFRALWRAPRVPMLVALILGIAFTLLLTSCASVAGGKRWYAPTTWFSHAPASAADRARANATQASSLADTAAESVTRAAHIEFAKADVAALTLPPSRSTDLVRRFLPNGLGLLDQVQPLTAVESADLRAVVAGLLSESAASVALAEKKQSAAETESTRLSRALVAAQTAAAAAAQRADAAVVKLRAAFDRENALANDLRAQHARFWILLAGFLLLLIGAAYIRLQLGGVGAALHAAGAPTALMSEIEKQTSAVGQWLIKTGRLAAAKAEAHLEAAAK
jgi:hypothetical protein